MLRSRLTLEPNNSPRDCEVVHSILPPALLIFLSAEWFLLSVADRLNAISRDALLQKRLLDRFRPAGSKRYVVFIRSRVVTMALDLTCPQLSFT